MRRIRFCCWLALLALGGTLWSVLLLSHPPFLSLRLRPFVPDFQLKWKLVTVHGFVVAAAALNSSSSIRGKGVDDLTKASRRETVSMESRGSSGLFAQSARGPSSGAELGLTKSLSVTNGSDERRHLFFLKVHKAASTTVMNVIFRFAQQRHLNIMVPKTYNVLSETDKDWVKAAVSLPPGRAHYDIICNHLVFSEPLVKQSLPPDSIYLAIVREPLAQAVSAFHYYRTVFPLPYLCNISGPDPLAAYLQDPWRWDKPPRLSFTHNRMSFDFGLDAEVMGNSTEVARYIQYLGSTFHLVMLSERFDESMVLLKRLMRWSLRDIMYVKNNVFLSSPVTKDCTALRKPTGKTSFASSSPSNSQYVTPESWTHVPPLKRHNFNQLERDTHRKFNSADYALYEHFADLFQKRVEAEGSDFPEEVAAFATMRDRVEWFCVEVNDSLQLLVLEGTQWSPAIVFSSEDCRYMMMEEQDLVEIQRTKQLFRSTRSTSSTSPKPSVAITKHLHLNSSINQV